MDVKDYPFSNITEKIIGCAMKVHSYFGLGFPELVYQKCLIVELEKASLRYKKEVEKEIWYHNMLIGKRRLDLMLKKRY